MHGEQPRWIRRTKRERGKVRYSLSSVAVERTDALELPGTNSSSSRGLFLAIPIFQKELFITPLAKYNKKWMGSRMESQGVTTCPCVTCKSRLKELHSAHPRVNVCIVHQFVCHYSVVILCFVVPFPASGFRPTCESEVHLRREYRRVSWVKPHQPGWVHWAAQPLGSASRAFRLLGSFNTTCKVRQHKCNLYSK